MVSPDQAKALAADHFPRGPEALAETLGVTIERSELVGCDGWCLYYPGASVVRINSRLGVHSQRFTLAHELSHLILGIPTTVGESCESMLRSDSQEEKRVNLLAGELLMPLAKVRSVVPDVPVIAKSLKRLSQQANVSELAAAIRVCNVAKEIGLDNAAAIFFNGDERQWTYSTTLDVPDEKASDLLARAMAVAPDPVRIPQGDEHLVVASVLENDVFGSQVLLVQLLPKADGNNISREERRLRFEAKLFSGDKKLQERVAGLFGGHKKRLIQGSATDAVAELWKLAQQKYPGTGMAAKLGYNYIVLRVAEWYPDGDD